ncbi:unnamed protein product [Ceratitis capitata]|uniref:(Mediterranean fruit fly) hypothetical protein n=1 Tax=Ceratitis capitata TaxID=7213 RepID=A0A811UIE8_CERCA|nr:unnamed protein product [Ceratitis capitata]
MELDSCDDGSYYDNFDKLMQQSDNYSLDDIDEILRSTDSHLDSSIDFNNLTPHNIRHFELPLEVDLHNSSTSGIQSDVSSVASQSKTYMEKSLNTDVENGTSEATYNGHGTIPALSIKEETVLTQYTPTIAVSMPLMVPVMPVNTITTNATASTTNLQQLQPLQQVQPISVLPGTFFPVKTIPLKTITQTSSNSKPAASIKIGPKLAPNVT